jgi:hypothetical protein
VKISATDLNVAIAAAISDNFVVTDQKIHQAGVEIVTAAEAIQKHLMTAMSLLGHVLRHCDQGTYACVEELWQEITDCHYEDVILMPIRSLAAMLEPRCSYHTT